MILPLSSDSNKSNDLAHYFKSAEKYLKNNEFFKSMNYILEVLRISPMNPIALNAMGILCWGLYKSGVSFGALALHYLNTCVDKDPENRQALVNLATMYHEQYQSHRARELCEQWLQKFPEDQNIRKLYDQIIQAPNTCASERISLNDDTFDAGEFNPDLFGVFVGSAQHKLAYLVIPKCGCSSLRDWILSLDYQGDGAILNNFHSRCDNDFTFFSPKNRPPRDFFKFTFVRNPYRRVLSFYTDRILNDPNETFITDEAPQYKDFFHSGMTFDEFTQRLSECPATSLEQHLAPQTYFLFSGNRLVVDFIGRLEKIEMDFRLVQKYISMETSLPHKRKTTNEDHKLLYTERTAALVYQKYKVDFSLLGYEEESWMESG